MVLPPGALPRMPGAPSGCTRPPGFTKDTGAALPPSCGMTRPGGGAMLVTVGDDPSCGMVKPGGGIA